MKPVCCSEGEYSTLKISVAINKLHEKFKKATKKAKKAVRGNKTCSGAERQT